LRGAFGNLKLFLSKPFQPASDVIHNQLMPQPIVEFVKMQGDYLLFVLGALVVAAIAHIIVRRLRAIDSLSFQLWPATILVLGLGWLVVEHSGDDARMENIALISAMAPTYAEELERMGHAHITEATPPDDPLYLELIQAEIRWQQLNPFAHDIYTFRKRADGTNVLIVDSETDYDRNGDFSGPNEGRTAIGTVYTAPDAGLEKAFLGNPNFDSQIISDQWGTWVSAFVPMRNPQGKVEAVLGVDFDAKMWLRAIAKARRYAILGVALLTTIVLGGVIGMALLRANLRRRSEDERRLRASEQRLQLTIQQMPLGFVEWDVAANVQIWNPAAERIFGFAAAEVMGRKIFSKIVVPSALDRADEIWASLLQNTGDSHYIHENLTKDGRTIICEWFNTALVGPDNRVVAVFSIFQDITSRLNLEKQLQHSERLNAVGQLSAGVAHDFNNILTIVTGHVGLLLANPEVSPEIKPDLERIENAALRAASLTRQLLAFSRQQAMFPRTLDLRKIVKEVGTMLARLISESVKFTVDVAAEVPFVEADPAMIEQIVTNLVLNARDAMPNGGELVVAVTAANLSSRDIPASVNARPGVFVKLAVSDTGDGIPAENISRIFDPFFTTKPTGKGTGLGLAVVHGIVQQHGGWITVDSVPGKGSTFGIYFLPSDKPVPTPDTALLKPSPSRVTPKASQTILLVEDEPMVRELASQILGNAGYLVLPAADGPQALGLWAQYQGQIDMLMTDMVMPNGINGRELSERLLVDRPGLPVIYASGYSLDLTAPGFCESERMLFLPKPYQAGDLVAAVQRCFNRGGRRAKAASAPPTSNSP
jgi:PAS domain S-box-containing protein